MLESTFEEVFKSIHMHSHSLPPLFISKGSFFSLLPSLCLSIFPRLYYLSLLSIYIYISFSLSICLSLSLFLHPLICISDNYNGTKKGVDPKEPMKGKSVLLMNNLTYRASKRANFSMLAFPCLQQSI